MTLEDLCNKIHENDEKLFNALENEDFDPMEFLSILKVATALKVDIIDIIEHKL